MKLTIHDLNDPSIIIPARYLDISICTLIRKYLYKTLILAMRDDIEYVCSLTRGYIFTAKEIYYIIIIIFAIFFCVRYFSILIVCSVKN